MNEYKNKSQKEFESLVKASFKLNIKFSTISKIIKKVKSWKQNKLESTK